jgi:1-acyl-sn-glycerol-3-phosphate acyltransferase
VNAPLYRFLDVIGFRSLFGRIYRVELAGQERIPADGPVILVANHESMVDPWVVGLLTNRTIHWMAKAELWRSRLLRPIVDGFGAFPVERGTGDSAAVGRAGRLLDDGSVLGIFPQGTCYPWPKRPWHRGAARLALATGTPVVPVCLVATEQVLRPRKPKVGFPTVRALAASPIRVDRQRPTVAAAKELTRELELAIETLRAPYGPPAHAWATESPPSRDTSRGQGQA